MERILLKKCLVLVILMLFCNLVISPAIGTHQVRNALNEISNLGSQTYTLPPPMDVDMILEESIFRRMSVREFTDESVSDEDLSTVLWAAYGLIDGEKMTVPSFNNVHAGVIYVLLKDAAYKYDPVNHSLVFFKEGDWRDIVGWQYDAPVQLGLCWDTDLADSYYGSAEVGAMGQNIYFMANALDLGTVVCGQYPPAINPLEIPENEEGLVVMPLGHPVNSYDFKYRPLWFSLLPSVKRSSMTLSTALEERSDGTSFDGTLSREELSQLLWSSYGFSYYLDRSDQELNPVKRHRTVPSAHGYYPFHFYAVTEDGVFKYEPSFLMKFRIVPADIFGFPIVSFIRNVNRGDHRQEIADACSDPTIGSAPLIVIPVLDVEMTRPEGLDDLSAEIYRRFWFYEAGASVHNIMLEATALGLTSNIYIPTDEDSISSLLKLSEEQQSLFLVPVGDL